ncbi:hypothetical protein RIF29_39131 [Crotalaria pallida]|uniref:HTH TFE/IIEalpha-type domain-containing protein n=1 Tax=Crotalaria pallida TaxID=3830 RepID=A0AAN9E1H9_CROPI
MTDHYNKLVKLVARAFYDDDISLKEDNNINNNTNNNNNQPKPGKRRRNDNRGIAVVILDALTRRRRWVSEQDLAFDLKLNRKQLRRTLNFLEEEKIIAREAVEKKRNTFSYYCCLDYEQIYDVVRYRVHGMKRKLKDGLENKKTVQEYICLDCGRRFNSLDAARLLSLEDGEFHCEHCYGKVEIGDGDGDGDNARGQRREKLKEMLQKMEVQLKPLMNQLVRVKDLPVPEFFTLEAWEARSRARAAHGDNAGDSTLHYGGDVQIVVDFSGTETEGKGEGDKSEIEDIALKGKYIKAYYAALLKQYELAEAAKKQQELPNSHVATYDHSNSTHAQARAADGDNNAVDLTMHNSGDFQVVVDFNGSKGVGDKSGTEDIALKDEYIKAYYAALLKQWELAEAAKKQEELSNSHTATYDHSCSTYDRQVGMKSKSEEDAEEDDGGIEWEEAPIGGNGNGSNRAMEWNVQAEEAHEGDDDDDSVDWEEG